MKTEYVTPDDLKDVLPIREKAKKHLKTWTKKQLVDQLSMSAKDGWIEKWAEEYDKGNYRGA